MPNLGSFRPRRCASFLGLLWVVAGTSVQAQVPPGAYVISSFQNSFSFPGRGGLWLFAGLVAKLAWEQTLGPLPMTARTAGGPVIVNAHLYGSLGGVLACGLIWADDARRRAGRSGGTEK